MKSILLTSTALVAFAGAAVADGHEGVSYALSGEFGYNSEVDGIGEDGFFWEGNLKTTATMDLDNGLTAGAYFEITIDGDNDTANDDQGQDLASSDFVLSLTSDTASIFFGDTGTAADKHWSSAGDMEQDGFTSGTDSNVLRGDVSFGGVDASISYLVDDANGTAEQLSFGAAASFGAIDLALAYQEETDYVDSDGDFNADEILGISAAGTFAGATVTVAYAENSTDGEDSTGIKVAYPVGPVTLTAYYVEESNGDPNTGINIAYADGPIAADLDIQDDQGVEKWKLEGTYDVGNGLTVLAGALNENEGDDPDFYIGADYDLGGGATASFAFAEDDDGDQGDEIGDPEYDPGVTISVSFSF